MKLNKVTLWALRLCSFAVAATSCSEGQYWTNGTKNPGEAYAFDKNSIDVAVPEEDEMPTYYDVKVRRTEAGESVTVPVLFSSKSDALTADSVVTFERGSYSADFRINIDTALCAKGYTYEATLELAAVDSIMIEEPADNLKMSFAIHQLLTLIWEPAGTAKAYSSWLEMSSSQAVVVPVEKAVNYQNERYDLYRLVSPYWYMSPEYNQEGFNIQFIVNQGSAYKASGLPDGWQEMGVIDSLEDGTAVDLFIGKTDNGGTLANQKTVYKINAPIGYRDVSADTDDPITEVSATETLTFTWTH